MSRRNAPALVLLAALAATVLAPGATASAMHPGDAPVVRSAAVGPGTAVLLRTGPTVLTAEVDVADDVAVEQVLASLHRDRDRADGSTGVPWAQSISLGRFTRVPGTSTWRARAYVDQDTPTGRYRLRVVAFDVDGGAGDADGLAPTYLKRNTRMPAFDAGRGPVAQGDPLTVGGRLTRLSPRHGYVGYVGKAVDVWFRPVGGAWSLVGRASTGADGRWTHAFRATVDGTWQARFAGTSHHHAQASGTDAVDVR